MNITLSPGVEKRIQELVERGDYPNADALIREAVGAFLDVESGEDLETIRRRIEICESEINRGEFVEYDAENIRELAKDVHARGKRRLARRRKTSPRVGGLHAC